MPAFVSALNRVDLPTFGRPTMPHFTLFLPEERLQQPAGFLRLRGLLDGHLLLCRLLLLLGLRLGRMQLLNRSLHVALEHVGQNLQRAVDRLVDRGFLFDGRLVQHEVTALGSRRRPADAQPQAPVLVRRQPLRDVLQAVVPGDAAALLEARHAGLEVELVVNHQDFLRLDLEEAGEHLHRLAAQVHERLRQQQPDVGMLADQRLELRILAQRDAVGLREALHQPEACVVPRALVLLARVAQADDQTNHFLSFLSAFSAGAFSAPAFGAALSPGLAPSAGASPSFGAAACSVVGTSAAETAAAACAASSSSVMSCGTTTVATTGSSALWIASSTPFGSISSRTCSDLPTARCSRFTSMNSGRSSGKQTMSSSFMTWLATPPCSFTP